MAVADNLAGVWMEIGWVHRGLTHRTEEAMDAFRQSGELWDRLSHENPAVLDFRWRRVASMEGLGDTLAESGRRAEAVKVLQPAIEEGERILAQDPIDSSRRSDLAQALTALGKALVFLGRANEAVSPLIRARSFLETLHRADPENSAYMADQARCIRFIAVALQNLHRDDEAILALADAVRLLERTSEEARSQNNYVISNLAVVSANLGELQFNMGRLTDAERTLEKTDALGRTYSGKDDTPRLDPSWLVPPRLLLGLVRIALGKREQAREPLLRADAALPGQSSPPLGYDFGFALVDSALADLAGTANEREEFDRKAAAAFRQVMAGAEPQALGELVSDPAYRRLLMRPDTSGLLFDRIFPANPFARAE
jgi:tetratricopeptide (TPR) repeat protein